MKTKTKLIALPLMAMGLLLSNTSCSDEASQKINATIEISKDVKSDPYNPMIFGGFIEHFHHQVYGGIFDPGSPFSDKKGFRLDVIEALKELKLPVMRWPGGCYVDGYHWENGVGTNRKPTDDIPWGTVEPNTFGTDEFVEFCHRLDSEPYICQNGLAGSKEMAGWVEYCNAKSGKLADLRAESGNKKPHQVKIWSVGNERGGMKYYNTVKEGAKAMKDVDPSILVTCSGTHGGPQIDSTLFKVAGQYLDYVSIHAYYIHNFQEFQNPDYMTCILKSEEPRKFIEGVVGSLEKSKVRGKIKLAFDEWNLRSWHHPGFPKETKVDLNDPEIKKLIDARNKNLDNSLYTMADALFAASFLNSCLMHSEDVIMANVAPIVNQTGPLFVSPEGLVRRPHFHAMSMYANMLEKYVAASTVKSDSISDDKTAIPAVDVIATTDKQTKKWVVSLINRDPKNEKICKVVLDKVPVNGQFKAKVLAGDSPDAFNDIKNPNRVQPQDVELKIRKGVVKLPAHSLTIFTIED